MGKCPGREKIYEIFFRENYMINKIPFMDLRIVNTFEKEILLKTFQRLMNHGQYIMGQEVDNFEKKFAT